MTICNNGTSVLNQCSTIFMGPPVEEVHHVAWPPLLVMGPPVEEVHHVAWPPLISIEALTSSKAPVEHWFRMNCSALSLIVTTEDGLLCALVQVNTYLLIAYC